MVSSTKTEKSICCYTLTTGDEMKLTVAHKHTLDPDCKGEWQSTARLSVVPFSRPFPEQVFLHDHMTVCIMPKVVTAQRIQNLYICSALVLAVFSVRY